jgi:hypothetical protein
MRIIGCDLHARQQTLAMLDTISGEVVNRSMMHEGTKCASFTFSFRARCWRACGKVSPVHPTTVS